MKSQELSALIREVFGGERAPKDYLPRTANLGHPDYQTLTAVIRGQSWEQVKPGFFEENPETMCLLSEKGIAHYLPRMILDAIDNQSYSPINEDLVSLLCVHCSETSHSSKNRFALLDEAQKKAVREYLEWILYYLNEGRFPRLERCLDCVQRTIFGER